MSYIFVVCFFGDSVTTRFAEIGDTICECNWYEFPLNIQKMLLTMLIVAQKPVYIQGLRDTHCTLEFLKKVWVFLYLNKSVELSLLRQVPFTSLQIMKAAFSCFLVLYVATAK